MSTKQTKVNSVIIIAEAGVNHDGNIDKAKALIDSASIAGADYVKFQTFKAEKVVTKEALKAEYQKNKINDDETQFHLLKKLELDFKSLKLLKEYCKKKKIGFLSTAFDNESLKFLIELGVDYIKIPSGEINNVPLLKLIATFNKPVLISTGMSYLKEIEWTFNFLIKSGLEKDNITILHCNSEYPTPVGDVNLRAMLSLEKKFNVNVGYSDHTLGVEVSTAAVALGAKVIEKHLTLDKKMSGPDHSASLDPNEFKQLVSAIRNIENAFGDGIKQPSFSENKNRDIVRRSIVASRNIKEGEIFSDENICLKRPGTGLSPTNWENLIGKRAKRNFSENEKIEI